VREGDFVSRVECVDRVEGGAEKDELHLLYLGRRHPLKGVEYLERAVREISTRSTRSTRLNIELRIVSNAKGEELDKVWEWCDVLVLPTLSENFGLVVAEALERGKRVITTDGAPVWESLVVSDQSLVVSGDGCGIGVGCGGGLLYLKGFRDGSDEKRVELLKQAISTL
jgi:glycosyltransferase involved in cell wall biosynthesis